MAIQVGEMRYTIKVKSLSSVKDEYGAAEEVYTNLVTLRASVKYLSGSKGIDLNEIFTSQAIQFTTYYRSVIEPTMRIEFNNKAYRILSIAEIGFKEGLLITTELINE